MSRLPIGILGCGAIARNAYLPSFTTHYSGEVELFACADAVPAAAAACAEKFGIPRVLSPEELLADPGIALVVNLTIPEAHEELNRKALLAGKHVYCEKPLALSRAEAIHLGKIAAEQGRMLAVAPDTILGAPHQAARKALDAGAVGTVRHVSAWCSLHIGLERYYRPAAGPILDFGPYYVGLMVFLLGPVTRVAALGAPVELPKEDGTKETFAPQTPSHAAVALQFASGATGTLGLSTDACIYESGIEVLGTSGRITVPDPNKFEGASHLKTYQEDVDLPADFALDGRHRGAGVADMAWALRDRRPHRLGNAFCVHCTELLVSILESLDTGRAVDLSTTCERPAPMAPRTAPHPFAWAG